MKKLTIGLNPVRSSNVESVGYDAPTQTLAVQFKGGKVYHYFDVPQEVHSGFGKAESVGKYIGANVVGKFKHALQAA